MEAAIVIKEKVQQLGGYKVIQKGNVIQSYNNMNQVFHFIDLSVYSGWYTLPRVDRFQIERAAERNYGMGICLMY